MDGSFQKDGLMGHSAERSDKKRLLSDLFNRLESLPLLLFILFFVILDAAGPELRSAKYVFDPPGLLFALNSVFITGLTLLIAWLCFRSFLRGGFLHVLLLGCGVLAFGLSSFVAGWLIRPPYGVNHTVTIHNTGVLCASVFFFLSALYTAFGISIEFEKRRGLIALMAYTGVFTVGAVLTAATLLHYTPPFFIAAEGPTVIRQVVLAVSVTLLATSALLMMTLYQERKSGFLLYSVNALLLIGAGLVGVALGTPGSPLSWLGRAAQYLGDVYLVVASMKALSEARSRGTTVEKALAGFFRRSETHYRVLVEMAADSIIAIDCKGKIILMNPAAENTFGYGREEAASRNLEELIVPEQSRGPFHACLSGESRRDLELELARKDGSIFPAELSFSPEMKSDGGFERTIIIRDVTERRRAEEAVRSAALFPIQNPEPVLRIHRDGTLLFANPAAGPVLAEWRTAHEDRFPDWVHQAVVAALNEGAPRDFETHIAGRDFSFVVTPIVKGQYANLYGWDVTNRKRAEEALQESEERYRRLFESMNEGFALHELICDEKGEPSDYRFLDVNPAFERLTGLKRQDVVGRTVIEVLPDIEPLWIKRYGEVALTGTPAHFESHTSALGRDYEVFSYRPAPGQFAAIFLDITERRQAEESLRASYELLKIAQRAANAGLWAWDIPTGKLTWSEEFYNLFGLDPRATASFDTWQGILHPDDRQQAMERINRSIQDGTPLENEYRIIRPDGRQRWIRVWGSTSYDESSRPLSMSGVCIDVTESKGAEEALRGSEARYRSYMEVTGQMGWTTNADGEVVEDRPAFRQYTGQTFDEIRGRGWLNALHPDDRELTLAIWRKAVEDKQSYETEYRLRRHDGVYRYFLARGVPILQDDGSVREWVGTCIDITERKEAEEALRQNEARFRQLADSMPQLVWTAEYDGRVDYFNSRLSSFTTHGPWRPYVYAEDYPLTAEAWKSAVRTGSPYEIEHRLQLADGRYRWFLTRAVPVPDETGRVMKWYGTSTDVDDRRRIEEEREIARSEAMNEKNRLEALIKTLPVGVALVDTEGGTIRSNDMFEQVWGEQRPETRSVGDYARYNAWWIDSGRQVQPDEWASARAIQKGETITGQLMKIERFDGTMAFVINSAAPITEFDGRITGSAVAILDITEQIEAEEALRQNEARSRLLSETAGRLLATDDPQGLVNELCRDVMEHLDCQAFFNFMVDEGAGRLRLNACAGIPEEEVRKLEWLDYGVAVCGCVARDNVRIVAEDIFHTPDARTDLVRSYGIQAYCCHPLKAQDRLIGTLSFGTKTRARFTPDEVDLMRNVADQVAIAMQRIQAQQKLRQSQEALRLANEELEQRVRERTTELILLLEDLEKSRDDLRKLASELVLTEERERKKISVALHDEVAQTLAAARMRIDLLRSMQGGDDARRALDEAQQLLVQAIRETRSLMTDISNPVLYDMGLQVAVQSLTEEVKARNGISFSSSFSGNLKTLAQDLEVMIFQLVKELVQNIVKHSGARKASILIVEEKDVVRVVVADDGQGFDAGNVGAVGLDGGFGLFSIRERVKSYHGKITIESEPGKGAEVTVMLPKKAAGGAASRKTGKRK
jgi:PAS domain S-box-containing protein